VNPVIAKWLKDPEFTALPETVRKQAVEEYFKQNLTDAEYYRQPPDIQEGARNNFVEQHFPAPLPPERGLIKEAASALTSGALAVEESIAGVAEMGLNQIAPDSKLTDAVSSARQLMTKSRQEGFMARPADLREGTVWEHPERLADLRWWIRAIGENLPNMAAMMLPGVGAMKGAKALGAGEKVIAWAGRAGAWGGAATIEAGSAYSQAKDEMKAEKRYSDEEIESIAAAEGVTVGIVNGILEVLPFDNLVLKKAGTDRLLKRIVRQAVVEGSTETAQEAVNILAEKIGHKPDQTFSDNIGRLLESGIIGGVLGAGAGAVVKPGQADAGIDPAAAASRDMGIATPPPSSGQSLDETGSATALAASPADTRNRDAARKDAARKKAEAMLASVIQEQNAEEQEKTTQTAGAAPLQGGPRVAPMRTMPVSAEASGPAAGTAQLSNDGPPPVQPAESSSATAIPEPQLQGGPRLAPVRTEPQQASQPGPASATATPSGAISPQQQASEALPQPSSPGPQLQGGQRIAPVRGQGVASLTGRRSNPAAQGAADAAGTLKSPVAAVSKSAVATLTGKKPAAAVKHDYSSTQVSLPSDVAREVVSFGSKIPDKEIYTRKDDDSYGRERQPHITVRYGMETVDPKEIAPAFAGLGPIKARIGKVSIFEADDHDVVKADIDSADLRKANRKVGETVDLPGETFKDYQPPVTIAYVKKGEGKKYVGDATLEGREVTFDSVQLSAKDGKLHEIKLGQPMPAAPSSKREKALQEYRDYVAGLTGEQQARIADLIEPDPRQPSLLLKKITRRLAEAATAPAGEPVAKNNLVPAQTIKAGGVEFIVQPLVKKEKLPAAPAERRIGVNRDGFQVYEKEDGHRYYIENGIAIEAPRGITPWGAKKPADSPGVLRSKGRNEYLTKEELAGFEAKEAGSQTASVTAAPERPAGSTRVETPAEVPAPKEPWQMTKLEYLSGAKDSDELSVRQAAHALHVKRAVADGKDVPAAVLKAYSNNVWAQTALEEKNKGAGVRTLAGKAAKKRPAEYGSKNKLVTSERAEELRAKLRAKLNQLSAGIDPELLAWGTELAVYHVEAGARKFGDFAKAMIADLGEKVKPFLRSFYEGARYFPGVEEMAKEMSPADEIAAAQLEATETAEKPSAVTTLTGKKAPKKDLTPAPASTTIDKKQEVSYEQPIQGQGAASAQLLPAGDGGKVPGRPKDAVYGDQGSDGAGLPAPGQAQGTRGVEPDRNRGDRAEHGVPDRRAGSRSHRRRPAAPDLGVGPEPAGSKRELAPPDRNHVIAPDDVIVPPGVEGKIKANIDAIQLLKLLQQEDRNPAPDEKKVLARYTGWGAFAQKVFNRDFTRYLKRDAHISPDNYFYADRGKAYLAWKEKYGQKLHPAPGGLLTPEEWDSAERSTINAHYTSREVIDAMWAMARRLGFAGGTVLEPAAGAGHFFGLMPDDLSAKSSLFGVEMDSISGGILKKLYPQANIQISPFEKSKGILDNSIDLAITNVPFGDIKVSDKRHPEYDGWKLHNYFLARSLSAVKPGGMMIAITSNWSLDAKAAGPARGYLAGQADLIGALRLPNTAFASNAGTEVVTDILILRKKDSTATSGGEDFRTTLHLEGPAAEEAYQRMEAARAALNEIEARKPAKDAGKNSKARYNEERDKAKGELDKAVDEIRRLHPVNEYFHRHPEMVLGKHAMSGSMYGSDTYTVEPTGKLSEQLAAAIETLPENIAGEGTSLAGIEKVEIAELSAKEGTLTIKDGQVRLIENGRLIHPQYANSKGEMQKVSPAQMQRVKAYLDIRDLTVRLFAAMNAESATDDEIAGLQRDLNDRYDAFVAKYGRFNGNTANSFLRKLDNDFAVVDALEVEAPGDGEAIRYEKAPVFETRTIYPFVEPDTASGIEDAASLSIIYRGELSPYYIADLLGETDFEKIKKDLVEKGLGFINPATGLIEPRDLYLSGNVKKKLARARLAAEDDPSFTANVQALEKVIPPDLDIEFITFRLGSSWVLPGAVEDFMQDVLEVTAEVSRRNTETGAGWSLKVKGGQYGVKSRETFGDRNYRADELVEMSLNLHHPRVMKTDANKHTYEDKDASKEAELKRKELNEEFVRWAKTHPKWGKELARVYNEEKNGTILRRHSEPAIDYYPGAARGIKLRSLQKIAVSRALQESVLLAYGVGTGKTIILITTAMEMRRIGTARKPVIVVHNQTIDQYRNTFKLLYPSARVLIPDMDQRSSKMRKKTLVSMATGNWDAIVLPQSFFDGIANDPGRERAFVDEQLAAIEDAIEDAKAGEGGDSFTVKDLVKLMERKRQKLEALLDRRKDEVLTFEEMGIDAILIDEVHSYKRSEFYTRLNKVKGIDNGSSQRSTGLILKAEFVRQKTGGKNVITATGTPISNTLAELWTMLRYVRPDLLKEYGVAQFDSFATDFGDVVEDTEETASGFREVERFAKYINGPELLSMFFSGADVRLTRDANLALPKIAGGKPTIVVNEKSPELTAFVKGIIEQWRAWEKLPGREKRKQRHVPLTLYNQAKKAAVDLRLIDPDYYPDEPTSKTNAAAKKIHEIWERTKSARSTQIVFLDLIKDDAKRPKFNLHQNLKQKLVALGIPEKEVLLFSETGTNEKLQARMKEQIRKGEARVIVGTTAKLGIGVDIAKKLKAAHHMNVPDRPMDIEQRDGRIVRQGNENEEVEIYHYCTKDTLDSVMFQRLMRKQKGADQVLTGDISGRDFDDPFSVEQATFGEFAAAASGKAGKLLFEKTDLLHKQHKYQIAEQSHVRRVSAARRQAAELPEKIERLAAEKNTATGVADYIETHFAGHKVVELTIDGETLPRKEAFARLAGKIEAIVAGWRAQFVGKPMGDFKKGAPSGMHGPELVEAIDFAMGDFAVKLAFSARTNYDRGAKPSTPLAFYTVEKDDGTVQERPLQNAFFVVSHKGRRLDSRQVSANTLPGALSRPFNEFLEAAADRPRYLQGRMDEAQKELAEFSAIAKEKFRYGDELKQIRRRIAAINRELTQLDEGGQGEPGDEVTPARVKPEESPQFAISRPGEVRSGEVTLSDVQAAFPGQAVGVSVNDPDVIWVRLANGRGIEIRKVDKIDPNRVAVNLGYGAMADDGVLVAGRYQDGTIELSRHLADRWILTHESVHFLEDAGLITPREVAALRQRIKQLSANGKWSALNKKDIGGPEDRAAWVAEQLKKRAAVSGIVGKTLQRIADLIDALANLVRRSVSARSVVRGIESGSLFSRPADGSESALRDSMPQYALVAAQPSGPAVTAELEKDRSFANKLFEMADQARQNVSVMTAKLQEQVQTLAGPASRKRIHLGIGYRPKIKESMQSRLLDQALFFYRDAGGDMSKIDGFKKTAALQLEDKEISGARRVYLQGVVKALDLASQLTDEQKAFADRMGEHFEAAYDLARDHKVVQSHVDNYVRRIYRKRPGEDGVNVMSGWSGPGHGFKTAHGAARPRTYETALDAIADGYELAVSGITNSYHEYMKELVTVLANRAFIQRGAGTKDASGRSLFTTNTSRVPGYENYRELKAEGFAVWQLAGAAEAVDMTGLGGVLETNSWGKKVFLAPPEQVPETWAVFADATATRAARVFTDERQAKTFADEQGYARIEHRPATEVSKLFQKQKLYAPASLAEMINKMTASDPLFANTPVLKLLSRFNSSIKGWVLMSSFFHHLAGARSWVFGVHHGWGRGKYVALSGDGDRVIGEFAGKDEARQAAGVDGIVLAPAKAAPFRAYKAGLDKVFDLHPLISLGVRQGLTLGEMQDWSDEILARDPGIAERIAAHFGWDKATDMIARGKFMRERWTNSLFKRYFAGLKAEAFCVEYVHELAKAQDLHHAGAAAPDPDLIAERVARLINEDFGGLHLKRMGRNPTLQILSRLMLLAPDWTESNFRMVTGMIPGLNEKISKAIGDVAPTPGMAPMYRKFMGRVILRIAVSTIIAQLLLNGKDDTEKHIDEQLRAGNWSKFRWTEIDISKLYRMLGIELDGERKTFSLGGHFFDPLKLLDPVKLIKGKASPFMRAMGAGFSGSDWADRPFTGAGELLTTGKTVKKSSHEPIESGFNRLPSVVVNQAINMQPIQVGQMLRFLQGEEDGLSALLHSAGIHVATAWQPKLATPIEAPAVAGKGFAEIERLQKGGILRMGPPSPNMTIGGVPHKMDKAQYREYLSRSSADAAARIETLAASGIYAKWDDATRARKIARIIENARARARKKVSRQLRATQR
jgi:N12 class adenine-specific DNA methylase